jgi:hypothetical protein
MSKKNKKNSIPKINNPQTISNPWSGSPNCQKKNKQHLLVFWGYVSLLIPCLVNQNFIGAVQFIGFPKKKSEKAQKSMEKAQLGFGLPSTEI